MFSQRDQRVITARLTDLRPEVEAALIQLAEVLDEKDCYVVTCKRAARAKPSLTDPTTFRLCRDDKAANGDPAVPHWDCDGRILIFGGKVIKRFARCALNQERVLTAFEEEGWPRRIDDPLPPTSGVGAKIRLHDTIKWLNRDLEQGMLRFVGDGTGEGVCWESITARPLVLFAESADNLRRAA